MTGCCADNCPNSSTKGFKMCHFPKEMSRRKIWIANVNRPGWVPGQSASLCEVHFAPEMWEKIRVDGTRKLKFNAVPTIFGDRILNDPLKVDDDISHNGNGTDDSVEMIVPDRQPVNNITNSNEPLVQIIPPAGSNAKPVPILIPASAILSAQTLNPTRTIVINSQGQIVSSQSPQIASILKPSVKNSPTSTPMVISSDPNILKSQIQLSNSQKPIIIPSTSSLLNAQGLPRNTRYVNVPRVCPKMPQNSRKVPAPKYVICAQGKSTKTNSPTSSLEAKNPSAIKIDNAGEKNFKSQAAVADNNSIANITNTLSEDREMDIEPQSSGIILNKTEAKRIEDERFEKMDKLLLKQLKLNNALRHKLNLMNQKMQQLMKEQHNNVHSVEFLKDVFTDDQIRALELRHTNPKSNIAWSHKTMVKAIKLKEECGTRGYEELLRQNIPLPSIRTICRWCTARDLPIP